MVYYNLGVAGMLMMCFAIPTFFIVSTGQDGSHFSMNILSWISLGIGITAIAFMIYSYSIAKKLINNNQTRCRTRMSLDKDLIVAFTLTIGATLVLGYFLYQMNPTATLLVFGIGYPVGFLLILFMFFGVKDTFNFILNRPFEDEKQSRHPVD